MTCLFRPYSPQSVFAESSDQIHQQAQFDGDGILVPPGPDEPLRRLLTQHPTSHGELKATIESVLEETEWPSKSKKVAQDLLQIVQGISGLEHHNSDPQKATRAMRDVWQQVKEASLKYHGTQGRGLIGKAKAFLGGSAKRCTRALTACREELLSSIPETTTMPSGAPSRRESVLRPERSLPTLRNEESRQRLLGFRARIFRPRKRSTLAPSGGDVGTQIISISPTPVKVNGSFCDVFIGTHSTVGKVALKRPRIGAAGSKEDIMRRFQREAETWEKLQHPHILPYIGSFQIDGQLYLVTPFIENGTLDEYVTRNLNVNRVKLLCETADAIAYLHQQGVVHGDIKASNILIGSNVQALLCDFGLTRAVDFRTSTAMRGAGTLRWQSPELWNGSSKSFKSDVYAFGMTIVEVLTGEVPFPELRTDGAVIHAVSFQGKRPPKNPTASSAGLSYGPVWAVAEACWAALPEERISMMGALQRIQEDPALAGMQTI